MKFDNDFDLDRILVKIDEDNPIDRKLYDHIMKGTCKGSKQMKEIKEESNEEESEGSKSPKMFRLSVNSDDEGEDFDFE